MRDGGRRRFPVWLVVTSLIGGTLLCAALPLVLFMLSGIVGNIAAGSCDEQERAAFHEIQHLASVEVRNHEGSCHGIYQAPKPPQEVIAHYKRQLEARGWVVMERPSQQEGGGGAEFGGSLTARRGEFWYEVGYESLGMYENPPEGMDSGSHIAVLVGKSER